MENKTQIMLNSLNRSDYYKVKYYEKQNRITLYTDKESGKKYFFEEDYLAIDRKGGCISKGTTPLSEEIKQQPLVCYSYGSDPVRADFVRRRAKKVNATKYYDEETNYKYYLATEFYQPEFERLADGFGVDIEKLKQFCVEEYNKNKRS